MNKCITAVSFAVLLAAAKPAPAQNGYTWKNVALSGAGAMVTGVYIHPAQQGLIYIRTDVGGSYRWDAANSKWIPLNDLLNFEERYLYSCEALAIDPNNTNVVYYAGGFSTSKGNGALYKSNNKGSTWTKLSLSLPMGGNMDRRWAGERLMVDPYNSNVILFGSRTDGLWRSQDGGGNWSKIGSIPTAANTYGVQCVAFDPGTNGKAYAFVSGGAAYVSNDHGVSWSSIGGSNIMRMKVSPNGTLWCTTRTGVSKYQSGGWTNYSVAGTDVYLALGINPSNASDVLVGKGESGGNYSIWRTTNGGANWSQVIYTVASTATWATPALHNYRPCDFAFDPFNTAIVWGDRWRTTNINASTVAWVQQELGHEEDVTGAAIAPPSGYELLVGVYDDDGFALNNGLDSFPSKQLGIVNSWNGHTWGMAFQQNNPLNMARVGGQPFYGGTIAVAKSTDGGANWTRMPFPANLFPLSCAISATNGNNIVVICNANYSSDPTGKNWTPVTASNPWRYTTDGGSSWSIISGLPTPPAPYGPWFHTVFLAADPVNGSKFYYSSTNGRLYRSTDGGASFAWVNTTQLFPAKQWHQLKVRPGVEGDLWICVDNDNTDYQGFNRTADEGLYRSTDSGVTWSKISSVNRAFTFGFGKAPTGSTTPALFLYGRVNGGTADSIWRSLDLGQTWSNIQDPLNCMGDMPYIVEGSRQTYGRVFVGTGGRGFFYGSLVTTTPYGGSPAAVPGTIQAENYDNGGEGAAYHDTTVNNNGGQYRTSEGVDIETCTDNGGGYDLSYTAAGEWLQYTVNVASANAYLVSFRVASGNSGASFHLEDQNGNNLTGSVAVPNTGGWQAWTTVNRTVSLPAGQQRLKFVEETGGFNLNYMSFTAAYPYLGTPAAIPGSISARNFNKGGEGIGYHDTDTVNSGGAYRANDGVDIQACSDSGGGYNVYNTAAGEWLRFTVNVASAGTYTVSFRVAAAASGTLHLEDQNGNNLTGAVTVPATGGGQVWTTVTKTVSMNAGLQVLRVVEDSGSFGINYMSFN